jgi:hypothetical protein
VYRTLRCIAHGQGRFVVVGFFGNVLTSDNGLVWENHALDKPYHLVTVTYGNGMFLAASGAGKVLASEDAVRWSTYDFGSSTAFAGAAYGKGKFLVLGTSALELDVSRGLLLEPSLGPSGFAASLFGELGKVYRLEATPSLQPETWSEVGVVTNTAFTTGFRESHLPAAPVRFYRAVLQP